MPAKTRHWIYRRTFGTWEFRWLGGAHCALWLQRYRYTKILAIGPFRFVLENQTV